jgi:hypothetical protein
MRKKESKDGRELRPVRFENPPKCEEEPMQPAQFFAAIALAFSSLWAPAAVQNPPAATAVMSATNTVNAADAEEGASLITGSIPAVLYRVNGEPLSCEMIRGMDEVELITDDSYCG